MSAILDVERARERSFAPPRGAVSPLPALEADETGFDEESFLRVLAGQLC